MQARTPSPARSHDASGSSRQHQLRNTRSVGSPGSSSVKLSSIIPFQENMNSFNLSETPVQAVPNADTGSKESKRKSWGTKLSDKYKDVVMNENEILETNEASTTLNKLVEEYIDIEVLSQERNNYAMDIPESSDNESIRSIIIPRRKLFTQKENQPHKYFGQIVLSRESKLQQTTRNDERLHVPSKKLFNQPSKPNNKIIFPAALLNISLNKTKGEAVAEPRVEVRTLFGNGAVTKRKNMFVDFIASESEDEISEIQPLKRVLFQNKHEQRKGLSYAYRREQSPTSSITTENEMDEWKLLPSSTMIENQLEVMIGTAGTPFKRARLTEDIETANTETHNTNRTKHLNKSKTNEKSVIYSEPLVKNKSPLKDQKQQAEEKDVNHQVENVYNIKNAVGIQQQDDCSPRNGGELPVTKEIDVTLTNKKLNTTFDKNLGIIMTKPSSTNNKSTVVDSSFTNKVSDANMSLNTTKVPNIPKTLDTQSIANISINKSKSQNKSKTNNKSINSSNLRNVNQVQSDVKKNAEEHGVGDEDDQDKFEVSNVDNQDGEESDIEDQEDGDESVEGESENVHSDLENQDGHNEHMETNHAGNEESDLDKHEEYEESIVDDQEEEVVNTESSEINQDKQEENKNQSLELQEESEEEKIEEQEESDDGNEEMQEGTEEEIIEDLEENGEIMHEQQENTEENIEGQKDSAEEDQEGPDESENEELEEYNEVLQEEVENDDDQHEEENQEIDAINSSGEIHDTNEDDKQSDKDDSQETNNDYMDIQDAETTGRHSNTDESKIHSPEVIRHDKTKQMQSFLGKGRNTSLRRTSIMRSMNLATSFAPPRDSTRLSDGTKNSTVEGSGWDSHRTTRKTLRQTFGKDFSPRKSLRALVMEKSAKRITTATDITSKFPQSNSTELPHTSNMQDEHVANDSNHDVSTRTRQTTLELYLQKIKNENTERNIRMEQEIRNSLKVPPKDIPDPFKVPSKAMFPLKKSSKNLLQNKSKPKQTKSNHIQFDNLPPEIIEDMKYKPPKRFQPGNAAWITKRLYKHFETKLEPKYDYKARLCAEKLIETVYQFSKHLRRHNVAPNDMVEELKHEMARLNVVKTHFEFYQFFHDFMPREVRIKVVPDIVNKIPLPKHGIFSDILNTSAVQD